MGLLMPMGENTEKPGVLLANESQPENKMGSEMLRQIEGELDLPLEAGETEEG